MIIWNWTDWCESESDIWNESECWLLVAAHDNLKLDWCESDIWHGSENEIWSLVAAHGNLKFEGMM